MKIIVTESQFNLLSEIDINNLDDLEKLGDYYDVVPKSTQKKLAEFLELVRKSGLVNMFEAGQFLFMTKDHFDDMIKFRSHRENFDDRKKEILKKVSSEIDMIRNLIINSAVQYLEKNKKSLSERNIQSTIRLIIKNTMSFWAQNLIKKP
jgi:hypothetical protein